jgi:hypothetical protein
MAYEVEGSEHFAVEARAMGLSLDCFQLVFLVSVVTLGLRGERGVGDMTGVILLVRG